MTGIVWKDPPGDPRRRWDWEAIAAELRAHPGQWAFLGTDMPTRYRTSIATGALRQFQPAGAFEARTANTGSYSGGRCDLYARYVGDPEIES